MNVCMWRKKAFQGSPLGTQSSTKYNRKELKNSVRSFLRRILASNSPEEVVVA